MHVLIRRIIKQQGQGCWQETSRTSKWMDTKKKRRPSIYSPFPPSFSVYMGDERNVSFLFEGGRVEEGELEGGGPTLDTARREKRRKVILRGEGMKGGRDRKLNGQRRAR